MKKREKKKKKLADSNPRSQCTREKIVFMHDCIHAC